MVQSLKAHLYVQVLVDNKAGGTVYRIRIDLVILLSVQHVVGPG